ncbi:MAG: DUF1800 domain-containing protein [Burkholderiales bacterium]
MWCPRSGLLAALIVAVSVVPGAMAAQPMGADEARHLLARAAFGGSPSEIATFAALTREQAVDRLLARAPTAPQTQPPAWVREPLPPPKQVAAMSPEERRTLLQEHNRRTIELRGWWISEMLATEEPLAERMTLFWHNHFVSSQQKVRAAQRIFEQNQLFRQHALGNFGALLHATIRDPAMAIYLDATSNRKERPNENLAREVMELFTLGEGHYTEADIREAARAFTGWIIEADSGQLVFARGRHDVGTKTVLGATGAFDADQVLDVLLAQPATAEFIVKKLWRELVSLEPDSTVAKPIAAAFRSSGYELRVALRGLLLANAFWAPQTRGALIKSPVDLVIGTMRQFQFEVSSPAALALVTSQLGQVLFAPPNVKGWPGGEAWINTSSLLSRKQFVERVFRVEETPAPMRIQGGQGAAGRARVAQAIDSIRFDGNRWFDAVKTANTNAGAGGVSAQCVALAIAPVVPLATTGPVTSRAQIAQLVLDPAYQLK